MRSRHGYFKGAGSVPGQALVAGRGRICNYWKRLKKLLENAPRRRARKCRCFCIALNPSLQCSHLCPSHDRPSGGLSIGDRAIERQIPIGQPAVSRCAHPGVLAEAPVRGAFARISADSGKTLARRTKNSPTGKMRSRHGYFKGAGSVPGQALVAGRGRICNYWKRLKKSLENGFGLLAGDSVLRVET